MPPERTSGFALVAVLCWAILLALAAGAVTRISTSEAISVRAGGEVARLDAIADAGINIALTSLLTRNDPRVPHPDGKPFNVVFEENDISVTMTDEDAKVDLNYAPRPTLARVLERDFLRLTRMGGFRRGQRSDSRCWLGGGGQH